MPIAFRVPDKYEIAETNFFGYAMHTPTSEPWLVAGRDHAGCTIVDAPADPCARNCYGCRDARREHDQGDEDPNR